MAAATLWALWRGNLSIWRGVGAWGGNPSSEDDRSPQCHKSPRKAEAVRLHFAHSVTAVWCSDGWDCLVFFLLPIRPLLSLAAHNCLVTESNSLIIARHGQEADHQMLSLCIAYVFCIVFMFLRYVREDIGFKLAFMLTGIFTH